MELDTRWISEIGRQFFSFAKLCLAHFPVLFHPEKEIHLILIRLNYLTTRILWYYKPGINGVMSLRTCSSVWLGLLYSLPNNCFTTLHVRPAEERIRPNQSGFLVSAFQPCGQNQPPKVNLFSFILYWRLKLVYVVSYVCVVWTYIQVDYIQCKKDEVDEKQPQSP